MKTRPLIVIVLGCVLTAAAAWFAFKYFNREAAGKPQSPAPAHVNARELRFPADSPQLAFIKSEAVAAVPEPLLDPLSARIAYDENYTARVASPIAGRVTRILVQPGDRIA